MIQGFLIAWFVVTALILGAAFAKALRNKKTPEKESKLDDSQIADLTRILKDRGIDAKVHRIPETPVEAVIYEAARILDAIKESDRTMIQWFSTLRDQRMESKRDTDAIMLALRAVTNGTSEILRIQQDGAKKPEPEENVETFVHTLEYARDRFTKNPTQKKTMETIINSVKKTYVGKSK